MLARSPSCRARSSLDTHERLLVARLIKACRPVRVLRDEVESEVLDLLPTLHLSLLVGYLHLLELLALLLEFVILQLASALLERLDAA